MKVRLFSIVLMLWNVVLFSQKSDKETINSVLDAWHNAAAEADFDAYFDKMTQNGVFLGTDATENWQNQEFQKALV